jgi:RNA polymerase-binding transcription factor DksA
MSEKDIVRYSDSDLQEFKELILKKIADIKQEMKFYDEEIKTANSSENKFNNLEDGSLTLERESMNQTLARLQKLQQHMEYALMRIENKTYGICRETGKLIPKERLLAVPHATLSVEAKNKSKR